LVSKYAIWQPWLQQSCQHSSFKVGQNMLRRHKILLPLQPISKNSLRNDLSKNFLRPPLTKKTVYVAWMALEKKEEEAPLSLSLSLSLSFHLKHFVYFHPSVLLFRGAAFP
jgi:hypothetical protein